MQTKFIKYEQVYKGFEKFFDGNDLKLMIDRKADIGLISQLADEKATKNELCESKVLIENVNERLKHVSVI